MSGSSSSSSSSSGNRLVREMLAHLDPPMPIVDRDDNSRVASFYNGRSILVTGATGFIGKALLEKLIRSCDGIKHIYVLIREKRNKGIQERLADLIKSQCFDRIREANNGSNQPLEEKLRAIKGDITLPKFGVSQEDLAVLSEECTVVFNSAATIRFVEPIDAAVRNNVYSVGQLVDFCDELKNLAALVHLSTAYSNCHKRDTIYEIFYEPPVAGDQIQATMVELKAIENKLHLYREDPESEKPIDEGGKPSMPRSRSSCQLQRFYSDVEPPTINDTNGGNVEQDGELLRKFTDMALRRANRPNTYAFTKAISENYLLDKVRARPDRYLGDKIPVAIVRPSIVTGAWREPLVGLVDNYNGPTGAILSFYTGVLQAAAGVGEGVADFVPVDMVTNMILSAGWFLVERKSIEGASKEIQHDQGVYLFNFVSGPRNPLHWHEVTDTIVKLAYKYPSKLLVRLPSAFFIRAGRRYDLYDLLNHKLPAYLIDLVKGKLLGQTLDRKNSALVAYSRIRQMIDTLTPFTSHQWKFDNSNVRRLYDALSPIDKSVFHFDISSVNWVEYLTSYIIGARIYTLKDEPDNVPAGLGIISRRKLISNVSIAMLVAMIFYFFFFMSECSHSAPLAAPITSQ